MKIVCPYCKTWFKPVIWYAIKECPCGASAAEVFLIKLLDVKSEIKDTKRWLKSADMPTETKDELRRRLNKI